MARAVSRDTPHHERSPARPRPDRRGVDPASLLDALRRGDPRAGALLYDACAPDVNRLVSRLLGADPDHHDIVQNVFVSVLRGASKVREPGALRGWVRTVTVHEVRDELRRRRLRRHVFGPVPDLDEVAAPAIDPERRRLIHATYAALAQLSADERLALSLRFVDAHTLPEVAERCGCSLATAKRRIARGRERFLALADRDPALRARVDGAAPLESGRTFVQPLVSIGRPRRGTPDRPDRRPPREDAPLSRSC